MKLPFTPMAGCLLYLCWVVQLSADEPQARPNVVYIMADELGYFEPGFNGGTNIKTPNLDRMATGGIRFTNIFAGSSVCAPTRCCLMTGKHSGHTSVRVNGGGTPLRANETTIASMLKALGYATGGFGKWGIGGRDSTGVPEKHGFDQFFGYYDQVHAHSYYPPYLIRNSEEVPLEGNNGGSQGKTYAHYKIHDAALQFIREQGKQQKPFFAYLPYTPPHGLFDIPDSDPAWAVYKDRTWPESARRYAAMVGMVDRQVGEVLGLLKELGIEKNTIVLFSGDNGGADYFASDDHPRGVHSANKDPNTGVEYRGKKGQLYEGGLRVPFVAYWPGKIAAGRVSDHLGYFPDILPTIAEITGAEMPTDIDGLSLLPTLLGAKNTNFTQQQHEFLYWEIGGATAIRQGPWRAVRNKPNGNWELYNLEVDPSEFKDIAADQLNVVAKLEALAKAAHTPAVEGTFTRTDRHERDRRAKMGQQDNLNAPDPLTVDKPSNKTAAMPTQGLLPNTDWKIARVSSENLDNQKFARNAIDSDPTTVWHTRFTGSVANPPHEIVIDLGTERTIGGFVYLARQDQSWNGSIKEIEFYVSNSPDEFEKPSITTTLKKSREPQSTVCATTQGRYVMLRAQSSYGNQPFASAAEIGILGN